MDTKFSTVGVSLIFVKVLGGMALNKAALFLYREYALAVRQIDQTFRSMLVHFPDGSPDEWIDRLNRTGEFLAGPWEWFPQGP